MVEFTLDMDRKLAYGTVRGMLPWQPKPHTLPHIFLPKFEVGIGETEITRVTFYKEELNALLLCFWGREGRRSHWREFM